VHNKFDFDPSLRAQTSNGSIAGTIVDKTGGAVVKATVSATSQDFGTVLEAQLRTVLGVTELMLWFRASTQ